MSTVITVLLVVNETLSGYRKESQARNVVRDRTIPGSNPQITVSLEECFEEKPVIW